MKLSVPMEEIYIDMFEVSEQWNHSINRTLQYIAEGKNVIVEVPKENCMYLLSKEAEDNFIISKDNMDKVNYEPIDFMNWLYSKAPFFEMVGIARH